MRPRHESAFQKRHGNDDPASKITNTKQEVSVQHACVLPMLQAFKRAICSTYPTVSSSSPCPPFLHYDDQHFKRYFRVNRQ
jgi:hypothetical protein